MHRYLYTYYELVLLLVASIINSKYYLGSSKIYVYLLILCHVVHLAQAILDSDLYLTRLPNED